MNRLDSTLTASLESTVFSVAWFAVNARKVAPAKLLKPIRSPLSFLARTRVIMSTPVRVVV